MVIYRQYNSLPNNIFLFLRKIENKPESTQRELAQELGLSLGKLNYCLKALKLKGLIKIENFKQNNNIWFWNNLPLFY